MKDIYYLHQLSTQDAVKNMKIKTDNYQNLL